MTSSSAVASVRPVTVTILLVFQSSALKVNVLDAAGVGLPPTEISPSVASVLVTVTFVSADGRLTRRTPKVSVRRLPDASVVRVEPPLSVTRMPGSSLTTVSVTPSGGRTAAALQHAVASAPETVNVRSRLATALSAEVIVTDCSAAVSAVVLEVSPASMVKVVSPVPSERPAPAGTETVIDTGTLTAVGMDAVTVLLPPFSGIVGVPSVSATLGASAASMIVADPAICPPVFEMQQSKLSALRKSTTVERPGDARLALAVQSIVAVLPLKDTVLKERPDCSHPLHVRLFENACQRYAMRKWGGQC